MTVKPNKLVSESLAKFGVVRFNVRTPSSHSCNAITSKTTIFITITLSSHIVFVFVLFTLGVEPSAHRKSLLSVQLFNGRAGRWSGRNHASFLEHSNECLRCAQCEHVAKWGENLVEHYGRENVLELLPCNACVQPVDPSVGQNVVGVPIAQKSFQLKILHRFDDACGRLRRENVNFLQCNQKHL